jgi:D-beta-D-heptose 7-phosphate kinase/D-beta-D-heptose 1-phosphate adenosyltransferase
MSVESPTDVVSRLRDVSILCIGDTILDRFVSGEVSRISPEAPIPILQSSKIRSAAGGAGNVVNNLCALGARVHFVSLVGDDAEGRELGEIARQQCERAQLLIDRERPTSLKTRYIADGQQILRVDRESTEPISAVSSAKLLAAIEESLPEVAAVVLSDYAKGVLTEGVLQAIIKACNIRDLKVFVDPKGGRYDRYAGAYVLTPNAKELEEAVGQRIDSDEAAKSAARNLIATHHVPVILATRGSHGMSLVTETSCSHMVAHAREVYDVSGAGDTVIATFSLACAAGVNLAEAAELANITAGIVVGKAGTAVVQAHELYDALAAQQHSFPNKLLSLAGAIDTVARWRTDGLKVGFTNGCFDLIHPGHLSLITQASRSCDRLIIALNSDDSVARLKGPKRPIQGEHVRAAVLAEFESVDGVLVFRGDTPLAEIQALSPDVLIKGADYSETEVVGSEFVRANGGRVMLAELVSGYSTTNTINAIENATTTPKAVKQ